jgi:integrase
MVELFSVAADGDQTGITWEDVDLTGGTMTVFGKNRTTETAPLLDEAIRLLRQWKQFRQPPDSEAVFPRLYNAAKGLDPTPAISTQSARKIISSLYD